MFQQVFEKILMTVAMVAIWRASWMLMDYYLKGSITATWFSLILGMIYIIYINQYQQ
jgi:hypothetical protein